LERGQVCTSTHEYLIRGKIGEGGMGVVYHAYDQKLKRDVAFKVLRQPHDDLLERFIREQEMTAALDHPNFVRVLSSGYVASRESASRSILPGVGSALNGAAQFEQVRRTRRLWRPAPPAAPRR
jgi:serine/threonine protein kinase